MPYRNNNESNRLVSLKQAVFWIAFDSYSGPSSVQLRNFQKEAEEISSVSSSPLSRKTPEKIRMEAEDQAWTELRNALGKGEMTAQGCFSDQKIRQQWRVANADEAWEMHSNHPVPVVANLWVDGNIEWQAGILTFDHGQYIKVGVFESILHCLWPDPSLTARDPEMPKSRWKSGKPALRSTPTEHLELINKAVDKFWIDGREPVASKTDIVEWLMQNQVNGQPLSENLAQAIGTMILPPHLRKGGIKSKEWIQNRKK
jgi:hypothetical protein